MSPLLIRVVFEIATYFGIIIGMTAALIHEFNKEV